MKSGTTKEILRIFIAAGIGFWAVKRVHLSTGLNILMFFLIYLAVSFLIEGVIYLYRRKR